MAKFQVKPDSADRLRCILLKMNRLLSDCVVGYSRSSAPSCVEDVTEDIEMAVKWQIRENYAQIQMNNYDNFSMMYGSVINWRKAIGGEFDFLQDDFVQSYVSAHFPYLGHVEYLDPEYGVIEGTGFDMVAQNVSFDLGLVLPGYLMADHVNDDYLRVYCSNMLQVYEAGFWPYGLVDPWLDYPNQKPSKVLAYQIPKRNYPVRKATG